MSSSSISQRANAFDDRVDRLPTTSKCRRAQCSHGRSEHARRLEPDLAYHERSSGVVTSEFRQIILLSCLLGVESLIVNQGLKRLFRRQRPTEHGAEGLTVRKPQTSSFPSGHASAAAFSSVLLSAMTGGWWIACGLRLQQLSP